MSSFSSSSYLSSATTVPGCNAWANFTVGSAGNVSLLDGFGVSAINRASTGLYGISFSNPGEFSSGAYVVIATPEFTTDGREISAVSGFGPVAVAVPNGRTGAGISGGIRVRTFTFPNGFHAAGGTASQNDPTTGQMRVNVAAFSFSNDSNTGIPAHGNYLGSSEDFTGSLSLWTTQFSGVGQEPVVTPNQEKNPLTGDMTATLVRFNCVDQSSGSNQSFLRQNISPAFLGASGKSWTWSIWAKGAVGGEKIIARGAAESAYQVLNLTTQWNRYYFTETSSISSPLFSIGLRGGFGGDTAANVYLWGAQHEPGIAASNYIKTDEYPPVFGNQDPNKRLVPGAAGFGLTGNTYASAHHRGYDKRRAVAHGTIVIPPVKGNSSPVTAYIENGLNVVSGVSAGSNSLFDITFVKPMANTNYCVILSGEYETINAAALSNEFSLLAVRAGASNRHKTVNGFRIEALKQNTTNNSWTNQSAIYQSGLYERIHFMVFGAYNQ